MLGIVKTHECSFLITKYPIPMKSVIIKILFLLPILSFGQEKNSVGLHLSNSAISGLNVNLQYQRFLSDKDALRFEIGTNLQRYLSIYNYKLGYSRNVLTLNKLKFWAGIEYQFGRLDYRFLDQGVHYHKSIGLTIESRYQISDKISLYGGFTIPVKNFESSYLKNERHGLEDIRLGVSYRF